MSARVVFAAILAVLPPTFAARADEPPRDWQSCTQIAERDARLACFDSAAQSAAVKPTPIPTPIPTPTPTPTPTLTLKPTPADETAVANAGCDRDDPSALSRFWELDRRTSCGVFGIRGYRPISLSLVRGVRVNDQPTSDNPLNNAATPQPYRKTETRIQLSVRTKLAQGLLPSGDGPRDSLWFAYTQQSYWQLFTPGLSRPFRNTDHEPEVIYVYPLAANLPGGWRLRYAGAGVVHQSNGQSLPLSRSWNRIYALAGAEHPGGLTLQARVWQRIPESAANDDNPRISDYVGRAEFTGRWDVDADDTVSLTYRNTLRGFEKGSVRLEWLKKISSRTPSPLGSLRVHAQVFSGYGDSLLDFNRRRTVFAVGLSLVDW